MKTTTIPTTRIIVANDLLGTRREYSSPQPAEECLQNNIELLFAVKFCDQLRMFEECDMEPPALSCAVRYDEANIAVRWFADGSPEAAMDELALVLKSQEPEGGAA